MKPIKIVTLLLLLNSTVHAQRTSDIGILISTDNESKLTLEYRKPIWKKYSLKFGTTYGSTHSSQFAPWAISQASDSLHIFNRNNSNENQYNLKIGIERILKSSPFSVGLDLLFGYKDVSYTKSVRHFTLDTTGKWDYTYFGEKDANTLNPKLDTTFGQIIFRYFKPALQLNLGLDLPLAKRFTVNLSYQHSVGLLINMSETQINNNTINTFDYINNEKFTFNYRFNVGLRYKFKT